MGNRWDLRNWIWMWTWVIVQFRIDEGFEFGSYIWETRLNYLILDGFMQIGN